MNTLVKIQDRLGSRRNPFHRCMPCLERNIESGYIDLSAHFVAIVKPGDCDSCCEEGEEQDRRRSEP